ncbi:glycosyl hydrolase family 28-related protein [Falsihalocynthiibacter sp. SS001]|uniref:glycosyl hydrolase family 28-related protein n=1 Tax=Falsihalocynthiibacter sp. SS001 TaxID=3349698 RepID=UPI0036D3E69D
MNIAITERLELMPSAFAGGLDVWSSQDGTAGSDTYDGSPYAAIVSADQDFGSCLELLKTNTTQKLHWMGKTPIIPGCYLRISARVKVVSGNLPDVQISGWAGEAQDAHVAGLVEVGPTKTLEGYGDVVEVSAIVGTGARVGVDMLWGLTATYGHFGLTFTGPNGSVVRIDDLRIEDATDVFLRDMMDWVDVRDYGAIGDGVTDDSDAFTAADNAANGREVLVPAGVFRLNSNVTFMNRVRFQGSVSMPVSARLALTKNYDLGTYVEAFGGDEVLAFKKALQALFNFTDHDSLDMQGRRIELTEPINVQEVVDNISGYAVRRVIRNGQFNVVDGPAWNDEVVTSVAKYSENDAKVLTNVDNIANIAVGSLVEGAGVGREVYVRAVNVGAKKVTLSQPLFGAAGTQNYTFTRFKYALDFSGFSGLDKFVLSDIEFQCNGHASAIMLAPDGLAFQVRDCFITKPKDRGITSPGGGCQGMLIDRCQFLSNEQSMRSQDRTTIAVNVNANDTKVRDNRVVRFASFGVWNGTGHLFSGNHWFHGDGETDGIRKAGLIFTTTNPKSTIVGNYIDNNFIEMTNEHDATPDFNSEFSFGGLTITGNIFTVNDVAPWFNWIVIKPYGTGHYLQGLNISGNVFRALNGSIDRVDHVDETYASLDMNKARNVVVEGNTFNLVNEPIFNPLSFRHTEESDSSSWTVDTEKKLPFGGMTKSMVGLVPDGKILRSSNTHVVEFPYTSLKQGSDQDELRVKWSVACRGTVHLTVRMDTPT